jgi:single-strand DNA-binding protein
MPNFNHTIQIGHLARDPETTQGKNGVVCHGCLAVNHPWKKEAPVVWLNWTAFGKTAEFIAANFKKGSCILLVGALVDNTYTDKEGNERKRIKMEVSDARFAEAKSQPTTVTPNNAKPAMVYDAKPTQAQQQEPDGDLPF